MKVKFLIVFLLFSSNMLAESIYLDVANSTPGKLNYQIAKTGVYENDIVGLKISGPLNGDDIIYIRKIAGRVSKSDYYGNFEYTKGKLKFLDLTDANIVSGGGYYYDYTYASTSSTTTKQYATRDNVITGAMFNGCRLKEILLPPNAHFDDCVGNGCEANIYFGEGVSGEGNWCLSGIKFIPYCFASIAPENYGHDNSGKYVGAYNGSFYCPPSLVDSYKSAKWSSAKAISHAIVYKDFVSNNHEDNSISSQETYVYIPSGATISFDYKVSSEEDCDYLKVTLNGKTLINKSGEQEGKYSSTLTNEIDGLLKIVYSKDEMANGGTDEASVKNIQVTFPGGMQYKGYFVSVEGGKYVLDDKTCMVSNTRMYVPNFTYRRTFNNTEWQCLYVPFSMNYEDWKDDFKVAAINDFHQYDTDDDGVFDKITMEVIEVKSGTLKPNHPYLIKALTSGQKNIHLSNVQFDSSLPYTFTCASMNAHFSFTGTYSGVSGETMRNKGYYAMSNGALQLAKNASVGLGGFRWYLKVESRDGQVIDMPSEILVKFLDKDDWTEGVEFRTIDTEGQATDCYDLMGRSVKGAVRGISIVNGKKIIK